MFQDYKFSEDKAVPVLLTSLPLGPSSVWHGVRAK